MGGRVLPLISPMCMPRLPPHHIGYICTVISEKNIFFALIGDEIPPSQDRRSQIRYLVSNNDFAQLKALNAKAQRMANDGWSVSLEDLKCNVT